MTVQLILLALSIQFTLSIAPGLSQTRVVVALPSTGGRRMNSAMRKEFRQFGGVGFRCANPTCKACILSC